MGAVSAARAEDAQGVASSRMSYSRFLEYLDMGRVKKVRARQKDPQGSLPQPTTLASRGLST